MMFIDFINEIREDLSENLNRHLSDKYGLEPVSFFGRNGFDVVQSPMSLSVYAASPSGNAYAQGGNGISAKATVEFFLNDSADEVSVERIEKYFSAIADYLTRQTYGEFSLITDSQISRMDIGDPCNEALFLVDARIQGATDEYFGCDYDN